MTEAHAIQVRLAALRHLQAAGPHGLGADVIMAGLNDEGWRLDAQQTLGTLHYLMERGMVLHRRRDIAATRPRYAITAAGSDTLEREQDPFAE